MKKLTLPTIFFIDHYERCDEGEIKIIRQGKKTCTVEMDQVAFEDLKSDAEYYTDEFGPDGIEDGGRLKRSAQATLNAIKNQVFERDESTKEEDMPKWLVKLIPSTADLDGLDEENQFDHIRFRVQHEIDISEEEGLDETGMTPKEYRDAIKFMEATGGRLS